MVVEIQPDSASSQAVATVTDRAFFGYLLEHGPTSRTNIATEVGLSRPTASEAAVRLTEAGLIVSAPSPHAPGRRGRTPDYYTVNSEFGHTLALAAASGTARVRTTDLLGNIVQDLRLDLGEKPMSHAELEKVLRELSHEAVALTGTPCLATTASQGNPVDPHTLAALVMPGAPFPEGHGDLLGVLRAVTEGPVLLDNDVNWSALAEQRVGVGRGVAEMLLVYLGPGIGAGVVMSGQVQRGNRGAAGELGYLRFGRQTLLEALLSQGVAAHGGQRLSLSRCRELFATGKSDDRAEQFIQILSSTLANIALFLDPQTLVLAGPLMEIPELAQALEHELDEIFGRESLQIRRATLGEDAPLIGAGIAARNLALEALWTNYRA